MAGQNEIITATGANRIARVLSADRHRKPAVPIDGLSKWRICGLLCLLLVCLAVAQPRRGHANEYVSCVQKQLKALGFFPEPADGELHPLTTQALTLFRQKAGSELFAQPDLNERTALTWCRVIGASEEQAAALMPSQKGPVILVDESEGDALLNAVTTAYKTAATYFRTRHNIRLASRIDIAASSDPEKLTAFLTKLRRARKESVKDLSVPVANQCRSLERVKAAALSNQIIFCLKNQAAFDQVIASEIQTDLNQTMIHEYTHHIQRELANAKLRSRPLGGMRRYLGPNWMVEGGAEYFTSQFQSPNRGREEMLAYLKSEVASTNKRLGELRPHRSVSTSDDYALALFATYVLAKRFGDESLLVYWREVGKGYPWEQAFEAAFGMTLESFESRFQDLRGNVGTATDFIDGKE